MQALKDSYKLVVCRETGRSRQRLWSEQPLRGRSVKKSLLKIFEVNVVFVQVSKAAIGLARLCLDPTTADSVVRLGGLDKLFPLAEVSN